MSRRVLLSITRPSSLYFTALKPARDLPTIFALQRRAPRLSIRNASTAIPPKTIVLEKPDKFRPPSHPQRLNRKPPRQYPGPPLSESERQAQKTRRYPHMFPNEGTPLHWFLTNKWIHMWISLVRLQCSRVRRPSFVTKASLSMEPEASAWWNSFANYDCGCAGHTDPPRHNNPNTILPPYLPLRSSHSTHLLPSPTPHQLRLRMALHHPPARRLQLAENG